MINRSFVVAAATAMALGASGAHALTANVLIGGNIPGYVAGEGLKSSIAGAVTETFNSQSGSAPFLSTVPGVSYGNITGGGAGIVTGTNTGYAAPQTATFTNTSKYLTVPVAGGSTPASVTITILNPAIQYFGLWWGSIDTYNTITFNSGAESYVYTGTMAGAAAAISPNGNQGQAAFFNFVFDKALTSITLTSTNIAFETDNHAFGTYSGPLTETIVTNVPVPGAAGLLLSGMVGLMAFSRRGRKAAKAA